MRKRKKRLSRPFHAALCLAAMVLILALNRLFCGPPRILTERTALSLAQRRALREPEEIAARADFRNWQVISVWNSGTKTLKKKEETGQDCAVWDEGAVQTYFFSWTRPGRRSYRYNADGETGLRLFRDPPLREYEWCRFWRDSRDFGWGCPGKTLSGYVLEDGRWVVREYVPLAVINGDPAVSSGVLTVSGSCAWDGETGNYAWTAAAVREDPHVFLFQLTPGEDLSSDMASWVLSDISMGEELFSAAAGKGVSDVTAFAEVVWYDRDGNELYRQGFDLLRTEKETEGSEEHGA
ncbi:MAG: hypothetical protein IKP17_04865 [Oscillospiraceae bacterium]|nr:hypothetical protein [Oscillospiraceae bacterium]